MTPEASAASDPEQREFVYRDDTVEHCLGVTAYSSWIKACAWDANLPPPYLAPDKSADAASRDAPTPGESDVADFSGQSHARPDYVPRLRIDMAPAQRSAYKDEVAVRLMKRLHEAPDEYAAVGGLRRLVLRVSEQSGWSRSDVYSALRRIADIDINLVEQSVKVLPAAQVEPEE